MANSLCKLCYQKPPVKNSHLLPRFAYKRYVSNPKRGGSFVDLQEMREHNRQLKKDWFCEDCEKLFAETYAADLLTQLDSNRTGCKYTDELLRFAASLSFRTCLYDLYDGDSGNANDALLRRVCKPWRDYLLGKTQTVRPYSQHAYVIADIDSPWAGRMGCEVAYVHNLVITQIGPLVVFGMLQDKSGASQRERWALEKSELTDAGGVLPNITQSEHNYVLTDDMTAELNHAGIWCVKKANEFESSQRS